MDDQMKIRDLNFKVTCLQNGLRIEKGQAHVVYQENQDLKREVDSLKVKLQNANEDKLATISAERKRWAREDFNALAIRDLEQQAKALIDARKMHIDNEMLMSPRDYMIYRSKLLLDEAKALKDQG
jgi:cell division septum initiation protein DivIVA